MLSVGRAIAYKSHILLLNLKFLVAEIGICVSPQIRKFIHRLKRDRFNHNNFEAVPNQDC